LSLCALTILPWLDFEAEDFVSLRYSFSFI